MIAHILNIAVGLTFSGGFLDLFLFGILQGNAKTSWLRIIPVGIIYFFLYYFIFSFLIKKFNFKTPGREDDDTETKLYTKADVNARKEAGKETAGNTGTADPVSEAITQGLGGKKNISDVDCCATRLRAVSEENSAEENTDTVNENNETQEKVVNTIVVSSPITGMAGDITTCPDEGFAGKMMGDGAVVTPEDLSLIHI